jgi:hypothetical protein
LAREEEVMPNILLTFDKELLDAIELARGERRRSEYIRSCLREVPEIKAGLKPKEARLVDDGQPDTTDG